MIDVRASCSTLPLCNRTENYHSAKMWVPCNKYWFPDNLGYGVGTEYIWSDGTNIYYSCEDRQRILNKDAGTWDTTTWNGFTDSTKFYGNHVWSDGTDIYYSYGTEHYVLTKETNTWEPMTWNGFTDFDGKNIWTDGTNIYYSGGSSQYRLTKDTHTWETMTWNGLTTFYAYDIWTDGTNIYCDSGYKLNGDTWEPMTWNGLTSFYGRDVWSDGTDVWLCGYYSSTQHKLNKNTNTWEETIWNDCIFPYPCFWTDGSNIFATDINDLGEWHYMLLPSTAKLYTKEERFWAKIKDLGNDAETETTTEAVLEEKTITENGTYSASDDGVDGYSKVTVNVPVPDGYVPEGTVPDGYVPEGTVPEGYVKPEGLLDITSNDVYDVKRYESVEVNVPIPSGYIKPSGTKSITENGDHDVTECASVSVNVPTYVTISSTDELSSITAYDGMIAVLGG